MKRRSDERRLDYRNHTMIEFNGLQHYQPHENGAYVALGFFDGVHLGHRAVIGGCADNSGNLPCVVLTFHESPAKSLGKNTPAMLSDNRRKAELMAKIGADEVIFADFAQIKDESPQEFVQGVLRDKLNAKKVYCGFNYRFGKNGRGDTETLRTLCGDLGIEVEVVEPVSVGGEQVSSSVIREFISGGKIERANEMLGYRFAVGGDIGTGNHFGTAMGFPTVNIPLTDGITAPRFGVYASIITVDGTAYRGATNIGVHPTVGANEKPLCETFLLDFPGGDLYGKRAVCELAAFIREEKRFGSAEELTEQVKKDCDTILSMSY